MNKFTNETSYYALIYLTETESAWKVADDNENEFWLPKSKCEVYPENPEEGSFAEFTIPNWLAEQKGLLG